MKPTIWPSVIHATHCPTCATFRLWVRPPDTTCPECRKATLDTLKRKSLSILRLAISDHWPAHRDGIERVWTAATKRMWASWHALHDHQRAALRETGEMPERYSIHKRRRGAA